MTVLLSSSNKRNSIALLKKKKKFSRVLILSSLGQRSDYDEENIRQADCDKNKTLCMSEARSFAPAEILS